MHLMPAESNTLFVDKVVPFRQKVADQRALREGQAFRDFLPRLGSYCSDQKQTLAESRFLQVVHETEIVQLSLDPPSYADGLPDVERLELMSESPSEDINGGCV